MTPTPVPFVVMLQVGLLATALVSSPGSHAYERDVHYYATFALAVAAGWSWRDARIIASADQGVDENKETVAALETDVEVTVPFSVPKPGIVHQAFQNFRLHSFSPVPGDQKEPTPEVRKAVNLCLEEANRVRTRLEVTPTDRMGTELLVAIGVYLHCLQDVGSHQGYGGRCHDYLRGVDYPGSCLAHAPDSARDSNAARRNPDHPAVKPDSNLHEALGESGKALAAILGQASSWKKFSIDSPSESWPKILKDRFRSQTIAKMPDAQRIACHRELAGVWLADFLRQKKVTRDIPPGAKKPRAAASCPEFPNNASEFIAIPQPEYPKLNRLAQARNVYQNGDYDTVSKTAKVNLAIDGIDTEQKCSYSGCRFHVKIQVSNLGPSSSETSFVVFAIIPENLEIQPFGVRIRLDSLAAGVFGREIGGEIVSPNGSKPIDKFVAYADIQPPRIKGEDPAWYDANVGNDTLLCASEASKDRAESAGRARCRRESRRESR